MILFQQENIHCTVHIIDCNLSEKKGKMVILIVITLILVFVFNVRAVNHRFCGCDNLYALKSEKAYVKHQEYP